jgi:AAA+ superfamily predicted ATPase
MASERKYIDLLVEDFGLVLDAGAQPVTTDNRHSIGQDIKHAVLESGLARALIGERSPVLRADVRTQIRILVEQDRRLVPGTAELREEAADRYLLTARTYEFGDLEVTL